MENVCNFAGNRVTRAPRALRPVQPTQVLTNSYGTHYNTYTGRILKHTYSTSCKHQPRKKRTDSTGFKRSQNPRKLRTSLHRPASIVNQILDSTHDILAPARAMTNLASGQTTTSPQRERHTSQTGKGGAHNQDPLHHHHQTTHDPHHKQRIAPQHSQHDRNL